jgi:4-amino-4-deoxy-L-arabinose transferase-like glycosyltransferase
VTPTRAGALAIVLLAAALRFWGIDDVPGGLLFDEAHNAADVLRVLAGERPLFFRENYGREPLFLYLQALSVGELGTSPYALRIVSAFFGVLAVPATYVSVRRLAGREAALFAAAWVATAPWPLISSRVGLRTIATPSLVALAVYGLARALHEPTGRRAVLAASGGAVAMAAALSAHIAARGMPLVPLVCYGVEAAGVPRLRRRAAMLLGVAGIVGAVGLTPLAAHFARHPDDLWRRADAVLADEVEPGGPSPTRGVAASIGAFVYRGDHRWDRNISGRPAFDPISSTAFVVGVGAALVTARRRIGSVWLLLWLIVGVLPNVIVGTGDANFSRVPAAQPAAAGLAGLGVAAALGLLRAHAARSVALASLVGIVGGLGISTFVTGWVQRPERFYAFGHDRLIALREAIDEARSGRRTFASGQDELEMLGRYLAGPEPGAPVTLFDSTRSLVLPPGGVGSTHLIASERGMPNELRRLLGRGEVVALDPHGGVAVERVRTAPRPAPALGREIGARLADLAALRDYALPGRVDPGTTTTLVLAFEPGRADARDLVWFAHLVDAERRVWARDDVRGFPAARWRAGDTVYLTFPLAVPADAPVGAYRVAAGAYDRATLGRLPIGTAADPVDLGPMWVGPAGTATQPGPSARRVGAHFGTSIELDGYEVDGATPRRLTLRWRASQPPPRDYTVFVHLLDEAGRLIAQADAMPARPTSTWQAGEPISDTRALPLAPAARSLRLGLYELSSGQRLPIEGGGDALDLALP